MASFFETITEAINDIVKNGFDTQKRIDDWLSKIRKSAIESLVPMQVVEKEVAATMQTIYKRMIVNGGILRFHPGISKYTLDMIKPKLRKELDRRIMANAQLIKLNREQMILKTQQRFSGWATSVPNGGSDAVDKKDTKVVIRKALAQLPFEERRVAIDQGAKFVAQLNNVVAVDRAAIAAEWQSHWRRPNYNYREDHKERDRRVYAIRGNWAMEKGLMKVGLAGYTDEITMPGEEVFCQCNYVYIYGVNKLPDNMLTQKGRDGIAKAIAEFGL
jgi:hypothetical protein